MTSDPTVAMASVIKNTAPGPCLAFNATRMLVALTWMPSAISPAFSVPVSSAAPTRPGSRPVNWLIALNKWVAQVAPASAAALHIT